MENQDGVLTLDTITQSASCAIYKTKAVEKSYEDAVNEFLDAVSIVRNSIDDLSSTINEIREEVSHYFNEKDNIQYKPEYDEVYPILKELIDVSLKYYVAAREPKVYSCLKSSVNNFKGEIDSFKETLEWLRKRYYVYLVSPRVASLEEKLLIANNKRKVA